jgi:hypothetical protein
MLALPCQVLGHVLTLSKQFACIFVCQNDDSYEEMRKKQWNNQQIDNFLDIIVSGNKYDGYSDNNSFHCTDDSIL